MLIAAFVLVCACLIIGAATGPAPKNWAVVALATLALILFVLGYAGSTGHSLFGR